MPSIRPIEATLMEPPWMGSNYRAPVILHNLESQRFQIAWQSQLNAPRVWVTLFLNGTPNMM